MNHPAAAPRRNGNVSTPSPLVALALFVFVSCALAQNAFAVKPLDPESPEATVNAFYGICIEEKVTGLPTDKQFEELRPLISESLANLLADARMEQAEFSRENPYEKPPWIEGDLFSSLFEGPTRFTAGKGVVKGNRATVTVSFGDDSAGETPFEWKDDVLLVLNADGDWVIDDIVYRGDWDFASKGTLSDALSPEKPEDDE
ncbi:MAG: hypothetical protein WC538_18725 [Thermoanaerobaculia bacterium]|jgi:hypothetical protein